MEHNAVARDQHPVHAQNFLRSAEFARELISLSNINSSDLVIDIGAGNGVITGELLKVAKKVIAIEIDKAYIPRLKDLNNSPSLEVVHADFSNWVLPETPYKVFSNIPFNFTADIVFKLTTAFHKPRDIFLIIQSDAAQRYMLNPDNSNTQAAILTALDFEVALLRRISPSHFLPKPKVNVVLAHFALRLRPIVLDQHKSLFRDFVVYCFNKWAPTFLDATRDVFSAKQIALLARSLKLRGLKPSELTIEQWLSVFDSFVSFVPEYKRKVVLGSEKRLRAMQARLSKQHRTRAFKPTRNR